jgi:hypothetical protein
MTIIKFTDTIGVPEEYRPKPADRFVPDWYKNLESYISGSKVPDGSGGTSATAKRCMPIFDAISGGYILTTYVDIWVKQMPQVPEETTVDENTDMSVFPTQPVYEWPSYVPLGFHPISQVPKHPIKGAHEISYPKWINPWSIKTPPGYSTLFIQPMHRDSVFTILPGIVDTDQYTAPVNFPFVLNEADEFEGLIPAGTPMAQVIPFKRDSWQMELGKIEDFNEQAKISNKLRTKFFDSYKTQYRQPKEYK